MSEEAGRSPEGASLYEAKVRAEFADADDAAGARSPSWAGDPLASVLVVKGVAGPAESAGRKPFSGSDGDALRKALAALGIAGGFLGVYSGDASREAAEERLAIQVASADPAIVIAADREAAELAASVLGVKAPRAGRALEVAGRRFVALDGFEAALADETAKKRAWQQLKALGGSGA